MVAKKKTEKPKRVRSKLPDGTTSKKLSIAGFRQKFPETAPNRYTVGVTEDPVTLVLDGGSTVTKGRGATMVVEDAGRVGKFRVELRSE